MIRALFRRGIRQHAVLLGVLCVGLLLFEVALVWAADSIEMGPEFRQMMGAILPENVVETLIGQFGFASFGGTVSFGYQHPLALVAAVAIVTVLATIPAHERETGLLDLILSRPLPRSKYLTASALLVFLGACLPPLALLAGGAVGLALVEGPETVTWAGYLPSAGVLALLLFSVGAYILLFSTFAKRRGVAVAQAVGITLVFYWLDFMGDYWDILETARLFSPFHFFDPAVAATSGTPVPHFLVLSGITVAATVGAFWSFSRQDL